ncbi:hypothetical protein NLJ89_g3409 [Agrocybe chaxingu]|uniref:Uncharacterized protein n=1 Tax=Agrocybe chaxingu TaxID=84603 RepID=A0A9W8KB38_9AGAR|nr:hypothetical protein NLJ89_g3409 [Agrocybe chaxingu]
MPRFVQVFQDTCPTLTFSAGWQGGSSETDASLDRYSQGTYTFTKQEDETMIMTSNGTYVGIYGAKRPDHGLYQVELDGKLFPTFDAHSDTPLFNQTLFNATSLEYGLHTIKLINAGNTTLDVDYVAFQGVTGKAQEALIPATWQDNEFAFSYFPPSSWRQSARPGTLSASTGTVTNDPRATAEFRFNGDFLPASIDVAPQVLTVVNS